MEVGIYGLGRFGAFWAEVLSEHFEVKGYSRNPARVTPKNVKRVSEDEVLKVKTLFLCVSISALGEVLQRVAERIKTGTVVIDTCSVKVYPARVMEETLPRGIKIIASHPMFGPDSGENGLKGLPLILWPLRGAEEEYGFWRGFFRSLGISVLRMSPEEHDREAAFTQGITHYLGRVIADLGLKESKIATVGYRKLLEIMNQTCNDPWQLFLDPQRYNPYTEEMREKLHNSLDKIMKLLEEI